MLLLRQTDERRRAGFTGQPASNIDSQGQGRPGRDRRKAMAPTFRNGGIGVFFILTSGKEKAAHEKD
jgi:hypothetical protein